MKNTPESVSDVSPMIPSAIATRSFQNLIAKAKIAMDLSSSDRFLKHEPCPACASRDNLARYSDGHAHCFGCGYYEPGERTLASVVSLDSRRPNARDGSSFTTKFSPSALRWLRQYGITDEELHGYRIKYDPWDDSIVLPFGQDVFQKRYLSSPNMKYQTFGKRSEATLEANETGQSEVLIYVEDIISAIKVGRVFAARPVLGIDVPTLGIERALESFRWVGVWLDSDKVVTASKAVLRANAWMGGNRVFRISSDQDPKCYEEAVIKEFVNGARPKPR